MNSWSNCSTTSNGGRRVTYYTNDSTSSTIKYRDDACKYMDVVFDKYGRIIQTNYYDEMEFKCDYNYKAWLTPEKIGRAKLVPETEERLENYIQENFDRYYIQEHGEYICQIIEEKAYDIIEEVLEDAREQYNIADEKIDDIVETIFKEIDFDSLYELVDDIEDAPITMEEKLADIGMSISDFI